MLSMRRVQTTGHKFNKLCKNVNIVEFHDHIWNHHEKCIQQSTNMPGIGLAIPEITLEMLEFLENKHICSVKPMPRVVSV